MKINLSKEVAATTSKKNRFDKKNVNVKVNPFINFQIGLVATLMIALAIIEISNVQVDTNPVRTIVENNIPDDDWNPKKFIAVPDHVVKKVKVVKPIKDVPPEIVPDDTPDLTPDPDIIPEPEPIVEPVIDSSDGDSSDNNPVVATPNTAPVKAVPKKAITTTMDGLDSMPLFPGCESLDDNEERRDCFNSKMQRFVQRKFNTGLANQLDVKDGELVKIIVLFTINEKGLPENVKVKAPHPALEEEAYRLIGKLPKITPGKVAGEPVNVYFQLPINFKVND